MTQQAPLAIEKDDRRACLLGAIERAAHLLPAQGPIRVFIHHNTLHAFDDQSFHDAVRNGSQVFGCQPYLTEDRYRDELRRGRIRFAELRAALEEDLDIRAHEPILPFCDRFSLRLAMLQYPLRSGSDPELTWSMAETDALRRIRPEVSEADRLRLITETRHWAMRDFRSERRAGTRPGWVEALRSQFPVSSMERWSDPTWEAFTLTALWHACQEGAARAAALAHRPPAPARHRDLLFAATGFDSDLPVHDLLIRLCAAFLDQGLSHWPLPERDRGLYAAFCALYRDAGWLPGWLSGLPASLRRLQAERIDPAASALESLELLGVAPQEWERYLPETLLALRGWAGMLWHVEQRGDRVHHPVPAGSLVEFLAVRLLLDRFALAAIARTHRGYRGALKDLRGTLQGNAAPPAALARAFGIFQLAQALGWLPADLAELDAAAWERLVREIEAFSEIDRRRLFQEAYERRLRVQALDALAAHRPREDALPAARPRFQAIFCIDEREESIRRHLEEIAPEAQTFGAAGFFGVAMYYRGAAEADFVPLCPVVVQPRHWVSEEVDPRLQLAHERRSRTRRWLGMMMHRFDRGSQTPLLGALLATGLGVLATVPLVMRILLPRWTGRFRGFLGGFLEPPAATALRLERTAPAPSPAPEGQGFAVEEMAQIAERLLRDIGLTAGFAPLVLILGHGSTSMNNPHESAHDCGACGGGVGGPNARAVARMLNDLRVRERLGGRGLAIPADTVFVGGLHNTSSETIRFFDIDGGRLPESHREPFETARQAIEESCTRNAHERSRRFASAPLGLAPSAARRHVEGRAEDLSQVRPEWGHATNALCIVGRRRRTRGLYLDRRAFLVSYDPAQDDADGAILTRILQAVFPVCSGINLEYYFSYVDSPGWGSGSKLPHNITSLLGVMDGAQSDLRTGLPWQMVEIHEPVRLLFVLEAKPATIVQILERNPALRSLAVNGWVQLAALDPDSQAIAFFRQDAFHPYLPEANRLPAASSSLDWYRGWRDHLNFAQIVPPERPAKGAESR